MSKKDYESEKNEDLAFSKEFKRQSKIKKRYKHLEECNHKEFQKEFVLEQAREICNYLKDLQFTPFRAWESSLREMVENESNDFLYKMYITKDEYGNYIPDTERAVELILTDPDPEEFPESRR